jgi:hypothetical protein
VLLWLSVASQHGSRAVAARFAEHRERFTDGTQIRLFVMAITGRARGAAWATERPFHSRPAQRAGTSAVRRVGGEQGVGIAGIHKIGTPGAQQSFHLLGCFLDHTARLAGLNLALQLD